MRKILGLMVISLAIVLAQVCLLNRLPWLGVPLDISLLWILAVAAATGVNAGAGMGFFVGMLLDLLPPAAHTPGRWMASLVIVGAIAGLFGQIRSRGAAAILAGLAALIATIFYRLFGIIFDDQTAAGNEFILTTGFAVILSAGLAGLILPWLANLVRSNFGEAG